MIKALSRLAERMMKTKLKTDVTLIKGSAAGYSDRPATGQKSEKLFSVYELFSIFNTDAVS